MPVTEFPLGTIIAWVSEPDKFRKGNNSISTPLPTGWTRCDGIRIEEGPWEGRITPDLNHRNVFLRGGIDSQELEYEDDMILDHEHIDNKHAHVDSGHDHQYSDKWMWFPIGPNGIYGESYHQDYEVETKTSETGYAQISLESSNIGAVKDGYAKGYETRPKNVKVVWLMKTS